MLVRWSGLAAIVPAYLGLLLGLASGTRRHRGALPRREVLVRLHRWLNLLALGLSAAHLAAYVVSPGGSLLVALVPQTAQVGAPAYTLGVLAFYLALLLGPSWYLRARLGRWVWLLAHQLAALSYAAALTHTLLLGSDVRVEGGWRICLWLAQVPLLVLFTLRLTRPRRPSDHLEAALREPRHDTPRLSRFRFAVHAGTGVTGFVVLCVALVAIGPGEHGTR